MAEDPSATIASRLAWLRDSGIQEPPGSPEAGGVHAWIDETSGAPAYLYSEITGYFMTLCAQLERAGYGPDWLVRGEAAARWIAERALDRSGAVLARKYADPRAAAADPYSFGRRRVLFFDSAMVGYGLLEIGRSTGNGRWIETARRIGKFALSAFDSKGGPHAACDLEPGCAIPPGPRWSQHFGSYELKGALFLESLAAETGDAAFRDLAARILVMALLFQDDTGRFPTDLERAATHLHPHFYTVEGLLWLAARRGRGDLLDPARRAIDWAFRECLLGKRTFQQWSGRPDLAIPGLRSDALAQALRAYEIAKLLAPSASFAWEEDVPSLRSKLDSFTLPSGGTSYGEDEHGKKTAHANAWCHFFATEAALFRKFREPGAPFDPATLVIT